MADQLGGRGDKVDPETWKIEILKYVSVSDIGKAIHPRECIAQDEGGVVFGIGHTLTEELLDDKGQPLNPNLIDYRVPRFSDLPLTLESILLEDQRPWTLWCEGHRRSRYSPRCFRGCRGAVSGGWCENSRLTADTGKNLARDENQRTRLCRTGRQEGERRRGEKRTRPPRYPFR